MMKKVMKRAWELAKEGVTKFGGKVREYFVSSLSIAWKEQKEMTKHELFEVAKTAAVPFGKGEAVITSHGFIYNEQYGGVELNLTTKIKIVFEGKVLAEGNHASTYDYPNANDFGKEYMSNRYEANNWDKSKGYSVVGAASTLGVETADEINEIIAQFKEDIETAYAEYTGGKTPAQKLAEEKSEEDKNKAHIEQLINLAAETGKKQLVGKRVVDCNGEVDECSTDIIYYYVDGQGNETTERVHTH